MVSITFLHREGRMIEVELIDGKLVEFPDRVRCADCGEVVATVFDHIAGCVEIVGYRATLGRESQAYCTAPECVAWMREHWCDGGTIEPRTADQFLADAGDDGRHIYCECGTALSHSRY